MKRNKLITALVGVAVVAATLALVHQLTVETVDPALAQEVNAASCMRWPFLKSNQAFRPAMTRLRELRIVGSNPITLEGLQHCRRLEVLEISGFGPILIDAEIHHLDLGPLAQLENLQGLTLDSQAIEDLRPLAGLRKLRHLSLANNWLTNLHPLSRLTNLESLDLSKAAGEIEELSAPLEWPDLAPLAPLTKLTELRLSGEPGVGGGDGPDYGHSRLDLTPILGLFELRRMDASNNILADPQQLCGFPNLVDLDLSYASAETGHGAMNRSNAPLSTLPSGSLATLKRLHTGPRIEKMELDAISQLPALETLAIVHPHPSGIPLDLAPLIGHRQLSRFYIPVDDPAVLAQDQVISLDRQGTEVFIRTSDYLGFLENWHMGRNF